MTESCTFVDARQATSTTQHIKWGGQTHIPTLSLLCFRTVPSPAINTNLSLTFFLCQWNLRPKLHERCGSNSTFRLATPK